MRGGKRFSAAGFAGMLVALIAVQEGIGYVGSRVGYIAGEYLINFADLFVYLDLGPEEPTGREAPGDLTGADIVLENVSFRYPQSKRDALTGITATIRAGERIALVGENGSGKSTLVKVLTGLYRPSAGRVCWGGRDLAALDLSEMRRQTADVFRRFAAMAGRRTAILVSHRLGSARLCDRVLVLKAGRLVESGSHEALLAQGGEYARLWALQAAWYEAAERAE